MKGSDFCLLFLIAICSLLQTATAVPAGTGIEDLFHQGNEAYSNGDYEQAISSYEQIIDTAGYAPSVLFNLGNSYAQAGKIGKAVLSYERGLRLAPSDLDISGNLQLLRKERGLFPKEFSGTDRFFQFLNFNQWATLILVSLALLTIFLLVAMIYRFTRRLTIGVSAICILLLCLSSAGSVYHYQIFNPSVVISPETRLFLSPFKTSASIGAIQEGRLVYPVKSHGQFTYVNDETDRKGWIPTEAIKAVSKAAIIESE